MTIGDRYEGSYVVYRDGWYYLMGSSMNCCAGPTTGYSVFAGRSRSPRGPFVDADGAALTDSRVGGTTVITQNGNKWIGPGHHAFITDAAGQDHIVYHAIDRGTPWLTDPFGINRRPMLIDRIDWIDGWPRTRAGLGPSEGPVPAPDDRLRARHRLHRSGRRAARRSAASPVTHLAVPIGCDLRVLRKTR